MAENPNAAPRSTWVEFMDETERMPIRELTEDESVEFEVGWLHIVRRDQFGSAYVSSYPAHRIRRVEHGS